MAPTGLYQRLSSYIRESGAHLVLTLLFSIWHLIVKTDRRDQTKLSRQCSLPVLPPHFQYVAPISGCCATILEIASVFKRHGFLKGSFGLIISLILIDNLHSPLCLAFLLFFDHPPITCPLPRRSFGRSSAHPLRHCVCLHLLRPHDLRHLHVRRGVILRDVSAIRLVSFLFPRHLQGRLTYRTSLWRAPLRKGCH